MTTALCAPHSPARINPEDFFAQSGTPEALRAKALCMACPMYFDCAAGAVEEGVTHGIWGGMSKSDRERVWKRQGGRPTLFLESYERHIRPLLQERRDFESFTEQEVS